MFSSGLIESFNERETPFYYYDLKLLQQSVNACMTAAGRYGFHVHYAMKANFNERILSAIKDSSMGADCVSGNEVKKAVEIGFAPQKIVRRSR